MITAVAGVVVLLAGCAADADDPDTAESPIVETVATEVPEPASGDFCDDANRFITSPVARLVTVPDAAMFASLDQQLGELERAAPVEIRADLATLKRGYAAIGEASQATGYDPGATLTVDVDVQQSSSAAAGSLDEYLRAECGLIEVEQDQIDQIVAAFGIEERPVGECLHAQLGDVANIASEDLTPEFLLQPVCGTSLFGLLSGEVDAG